MGEELLQLLHQGSLPATLHSLHAYDQRPLAACSLVGFDLIPAPEKDRNVILEDSHPAGYPLTFLGQPINQLYSIELAEGP